MSNDDDRTDFIYLQLSSLSMSLQLLYSYIQGRYHCSGLTSSLSPALHHAEDELPASEFTLSQKFAIGSIEHTVLI